MDGRPDSDLSKVLSTCGTCLGLADSRRDGADSLLIALFWAADLWFWEDTGVPVVVVLVAGIAKWDVNLPPRPFMAWWCLR